MIIKSSADIRQRYNEVERLCKETQEPIYLTKMGRAILSLWIFRPLKKENGCLN